MEGVVCVRLLGTVEVERDGEPVRGFRSRKALALLGYLAVQGQPVPRERLADLFWEGQSETRGRANLSWVIHRVSTLIPGCLQADRHAVRFARTPACRLDIDAFEDLEAQGDPASLAAAVALYRGQFLEGMTLKGCTEFELWLVGERERFHRRAASVLQELIRYHSQRGEYEEGARLAQRMLALEPWREEGHRQVMRFLAWGGQRGAALAQFETCRRTLSEELGVEPDRETRFLYRRIRDGNLQASQMPPHNLPAPLTRFVGREAELDQIAEQLNDPDTRLLTLVGPGGVGKTRLALAAARQAVAHFPDGAWFVSLIGVRGEPENELHDRLATGIAGALEISFSGQDDPKTQMLKHLESREALLILDSFEHLVSGADFILEVLRQAPKITVLVTSRARLNVRAERLVQVAGLPVPPQDDDPVAADYSSVQLFIDRAECVPGAPDHDPTQVASVCRLVEGVPLAIEMASAWVEQMGLSEIVANLRHDVDFLSTTFQDVPERHRRLRAVFESSWRLLGEPEQRALAQLAVFQGDFDRAAALAVASIQQAELVGLAHKSLLQHGDPDRYGLHALVRQFAAEKLDQFPALAEARERHSAYYLAFVGKRADDLQGDEPQQAVAEIQIEMADVRQAWQWAVDQIDAVPDPMGHITALGQCTQGLVQFYSQTGLFGEGAQVFRTAAGRVRAVAQNEATLSPEHLGTVLQILARLSAAQGVSLSYLGDHTAALTVQQEADRAFEKAAGALPDCNLSERAELLIDIGASHNRLGDYAQAVQHMEAGLALARQANAPRVEIKALCILGQATSEQGDYDAAKQHLNEALTLARQRGDRAREASALAMLGNTVWRCGDIEQAGHFVQESLAIYKELGDQRWITRLLNILGIVAIMQEDYTQAEAHWEEGLGMVQEMGDRQTTADLLTNLGYISHHHLANLEKANQYYQESLSISREIGHRHGATSTLSNLGHLHALMGEHALAWQYLREALSESAAIGVPPMTLDALAGVAQLRAATGQGDSAVELVGLIVNHPAVQDDSAKVAKTLLTELREALPAEQIEAALERGKGMELDAVVAELLADE